MDYGLGIHEAELDYSSGDHLTKNNKAYLTMAVENPATGIASYDNVKIAYEGA